MFNLDKNYIYLYYLFDSNIFQNKNNKKADLVNWLLKQNIKKLLSQQKFPVGVGGGGGKSNTCQQTQLEFCSKTVLVSKTYMYVYGSVTFRLIFFD